jgi:radical SAM superfamily enzyme YgiQ (UPF0313 family)
VFIGAFTSEVETAIKTAQMIKATYPEIVICIGGIHASIDPTVYEKAGCFDFVVRGEGEVTVPWIANQFGDRGFKLFDSNAVTLWGETPDLNLIPFADRELWSDYNERIQHPPPWLKEAPWVELLMARGCPFGCRFCSGPGEQGHFTKEVNGKRVPNIRGRSVQNVIDELHLLEDKYHFKSVQCHDDQFIMNTNWTWALIESLHETGLDNKKWWMGSRADVILRNKPLVLALRDVGLDIMSVGFESFSDELLTFWNKGTTAEQNYEAAKFLKDNGIRVFSNIIMGAPRPDGKWHIEDDMKNIEAMQKIQPSHNSWSIFTAVPGSDLYQWCIDEGLTVAKNAGFRCADETKIKGVSYRKIRMMMDGVDGLKRPWYHTAHDWLMMKVEGE